jgi:lysine 2,3-aminomutase
MPNLNESKASKQPFVISTFFDNYIKKIKSPPSLTLQFYPSDLETSQIQESGLYDPIGDHSNLKADKLIHRYKNRVLVMPTTACPVSCRYCFRRNPLAENDEMFKGQWKRTLAYLMEHSEVNEVIFTGGDPLMLSNRKLDMYLTDLSEIKHIKWIRFHSRVPIISPERLDADFVSLIDKFATKFNKIILAIHTNHLDELSPEFKHKTKVLNTTNIELISQTVLLKGVNDSPNALVELFEKLSELRIRPYYLHHPDKVKGAMHFYLPLSVGRKIYSKLRDRLPGWALPHYVIDIQDGAGKVSAFNPESYIYSGKLINKDGQLSPHSEPF